MYILVFIPFFFMEKSPGFEIGKFGNYAMYIFLIFVE